MVNSIFSPHNSCDAEPATNPDYVIKTKPLVYKGRIGIGREVHFFLLSKLPEVMKFTLEIGAKPLLPFC